jgi:hypothetical protein
MIPIECQRVGGKRGSGVEGLSGGGLGGWKGGGAERWKGGKAEGWRRGVEGRTKTVNIEQLVRFTSQNHFWCHPKRLPKLAKSHKKKREPIQFTIFLT